MRRAYVDTRHGQVHLRESGGGDRVLILIHWTPLSGRMFERLAPHLVSGGWRVVAPDLLGYGRSDPRPAQWSIEAWATSVGEVMDALGIANASVLGGHVGASVAVELALAQGPRVDRLVLDGCPIMTPELRAAFRAIGERQAPATATDPLDRTVGLLREYLPGYAPEGGQLELLWPTLVDYLETRFVSSAPIAGHYDIAPRLGLVQQPVLILGAELDSLAGTFATATALADTARSHRFPGRHPLLEDDRTHEYAAVVLDFLAGS